VMLSLPPVPVAFVEMDPRSPVKFPPVAIIKSFTPPVIAVCRGSFAPVLASPRVMPDLALRAREPVALILSRAPVIVSKPVLFENVAAVVDVIVPVPITIPPPEFILTVAAATLPMVPLIGVAVLTVNGVVPPELKVILLSLDERSKPVLARFLALISETVASVDDPNCTPPAATVRLPPVLTAIVPAELPSASS